MLESHAGETEANQDMMFISLSIVFVWCYIWIHTKSYFLSICGIGQILFSFPMAFVVYHFVLGIHMFLSIEFLSVFIILAIGADDCFVFVDAWTQSAQLAPNSELITRMSYTLKRSSKAMFVTSFTTFAAFMATGISDIKPISAFGTFSALLVIANYILVCTFFPCCVAIWHKRFRFKSLLRCLTLHWGIDVRMDGTMIKESPKVVKSIELMTKSPSSAASSSPINSTGVDTKPIAIVINNDNTTSNNNNGTSKNISAPVQKKKSSTYQDQRLRTIEKFFNGFWTEFTHQYRWIIIGVFILIGITGAVLTFQMTPIKEAENWLPDSMDIMKSKNFFETQFSQSSDDPNMPVIYVFGIAGLDTSDVSKWDPTDYGTLEWDNGFDLSIPSNQEWVLDFCTDLADQDKLIIQRDVTCFMEAYKEWRTGKGANFPATFTGTAAEIKSKFETDFKTFSDEQPYWISSQYVNFDDENHLKYVAISGNTFIDLNAVYDVKKPVYDMAIDFMDKKMVNAPNGLDNASMNGMGGWAWMFTSRSFITNLIQGIVIAMVVATIVLMISTQNWIVSIITMVNIVGILFCVIGSMKIRGWDLGVTESISGVVVVGFSFDYAVHLANSFVESNASTAKERMRTSMREMGISVVAGAITTAFAGSAMFFCFMMFFTKFAFMMVMNVTAALIWSCMFLPSMLMAIGPNKSGGHIPFEKFIHLFSSSKSSSKKSNSNNVDI
eukprot:TRINITY_DN4883_c0_g6_i1.p1 TRINITY_DN4883_c0_g6~~TRINITY_DN4883_c0_g6_i1.p1  ORF type:complete len:817 (-),score=224.69 TRINITY_DN4883_c0_g6_i1:591-2762(-)